MQIINNAIALFTILSTSMVFLPSVSGALRKATSNERTLTLRIINQTFMQPFSPFFVMVHNNKADPLYSRGQPASTAASTLGSWAWFTAHVAVYD